MISRAWTELAKQYPSNLKWAKQTEKAVNKFSRTYNNLLVLDKKPNLKNFYFTRVGRHD